MGKKVGRKPGRKKEYTGFTIDKECKNALDFLSEKNRVSKSWIVNECIYRGLKLMFDVDLTSDDWLEKWKEDNEIS